MSQNYNLIMTCLIKKLISTGSIILFTFIGLKAQIVALQYRAVPQENIDAITVIVKTLFIIFILFNI